MAFEWDEAKRLANIEKHGIDFADITEMFNGHVIENEDRRRDYGEQRIRAFGEVDGRVVQVVYTLRNGRRRVISARRARRNERRAYYAGDAGRSP
jgi:uncharacterized DUF497 family protein